MPYRVTGKHIYRASTRDIQMGTNPDGTPNIVRQSGPLEVCAVGTVLEDVQPHELAAFPDRLALIDDDEAQFLRARAAQPALRAGVGVHEPASGPGDLVQKPPLTAEQVVTLKQQEAAVRTTEVEAAEAHAKVDAEKQEKQAEAFAKLDAKAQAPQDSAPRGQAHRRAADEDKDKEKK